MDIKTKTEARQVFGTYAEIARVLGITKAAVSQWPETLSASTRDRLIGAAYRTGRMEARE